MKAKDHNGVLLFRTSLIVVVIGCRASVTAYLVGVGLISIVFEKTTHVKN